MPRDVVNCCSLYVLVLTLRQLKTFQLTDDEISEKRVWFFGFTTFELLNRREQRAGILKSNVQTQNFNSKIRRAKKKKAVN
jgi:hypothetical protein